MNESLKYISMRFMFGNNIYNMIVTRFYFYYYDFSRVSAQNYVSNSGMTITRIEHISSLFFCFVLIILSIAKHSDKVVRSSLWSSWIRQRHFKHLFLFGFVIVFVYLFLCFVFFRLFCLVFVCYLLFNICDVLLLYF